MDIFEEPNLLRNILFFLKPQDVVNLMISKGNFVYEHRFQDVTKHYLEKEKKNYIKRCEEAAYQERCRTFNKNIYDMITIFNTLDLKYEQIRYFKYFFDYILENKSLLQTNHYQQLINSIEDKLIYFMNDEDFHLEACYYLYEICGIAINVEPLPYTENSLIEFIINRHGKKIYI